ncbi:hypothetical protein AB0D04_03125 [Streptomyces sp. NPDC048483]|uniref:hypothetical protein n=1 Tax=Streptomyces sp. NPDC048483 TaxID=3154927 RepID=UPI00343C2E7F
MEERVKPSCGVGCLVGTIAAGVALWVWVHGAGPGVIGGFEGEQDLSLLYGELPLMLLGIPAVTLAAWGLTDRALRRTAGAYTRTAVSSAVAVVTLAVLAWACLAWLESRVAPFVHPGW